MPELLEVPLSMIELSICQILPLLLICFIYDMIGSVYDRETFFIPHSSQALIRPSIFSIRLLTRHTSRSWLSNVRFLPPIHGL